MIEQAARRFLKNGHEAGAAALAPIAGEIWDERIVQGRHARLAPVGKTTARPSFSRELAAKVYLRDHFHCRHCSARLMPLGLVALLAELYPKELPYVIYYTHGKMHPIFWRSVAEADHLLPPGSGGDWYAEDNHVTSCAACNTRKANYTLADLKATLQDVGDLGWDGLLPLYRPLWEAAGKPGSSHGEWLRAFERNA